MFLKKDRIFPFEEFHQWLSYGSSDLFSRREFSYATNNTYSRHNCYSDLNGFKEHLRKFQPDRIDIGAIYSIPVIILDLTFFYLEFYL